jgi:DNA-binding NtrC family response regulator
MSRPASPTVLLADAPDAEARELTAALRAAGYEVIAVHDSEGAFHAVDEAGVDCVVAELRAPRLDGMAVLRRARQRDPEVVGVLLTSGAPVERVVEAMREGAHDVQTRPVPAERLLAVLERGLAHRRLAARMAAMEEDLEGRLRLGGLDGRSSGLARVLAQIRTAGASRAPVLITGEPGTGKGLVARSLHQHSDRRDEPFLWVHCGALPADQLERELFGDEPAEGRPYRGRVALADGGTLLLEEVGEAPPLVQLRLLRLVQDREYERVGGAATRTADVRLVTSSSHDLDAAAREGRFRPDLLARIAVVRIAVPPLRERREDIPLLVQAAIRHFDREHGRRVTGITRGALERLLQHEWPGNVRELRAVVEGMVVGAMGRRRLDLGDLPPALREGGGRTEPLRIAVGMTVDEMERQLIGATLRAAGGDKRRAAAMLGIGLRTLYRKVARYGLQVAQDRGVPRR